MNGNVVRSIVMIMVLAVLSVIIGSQTTDSVRDSFGAFVVIGAIVAAFLLLLIGEKIWKLMYFIPAALTGCPLVFGQARLLRFGIPVAIFFCAVVMWGMGHMKLRWRTVLSLDLSVLLMTVIMVASFIRFPVSINALGLDTDFIGGAEYAWFVAATLYYIGISWMGRKPEEQLEVIKHTFWVLMLFQIPYAAYGSLGRFRGVIEGGVEGRFAALFLPAALLFYFTYASAPLHQLLTSVRTWFRILIALVMLSFVGGREVILQWAAAVGFIAFLKRELTAVICIALFIYGGLLVLSSQDVLKSAPYGMQRVLTMLPGIEVTESIAASTEGSSSTRKEIWAMMLDPRTGMLTDYVCGDGFQNSKEAQERATIAKMRGTIFAGYSTSGAGWAAELARSGSYHNGWLTVLKRLGFIGLGAVNMLFLTAMFALLRVSAAYRGTTYYPYIIALCMPLVSLALTLVIGTKTFIDIFLVYIQISYIKMLYCAAKDQGRLRSLLRQAPYIPMVIREQAP